MRDPTLQGDMELYLIYDKEFQAMLKSSRESNDRYYNLYLYSLIIMHPGCKDHDCVLQKLTLQLG